MTSGGRHHVPKLGLDLAPPRRRPMPLWSVAQHGTVIALLGLSRVADQRGD